MGFESKQKRISVRVEDIDTGEIVKTFDCGSDERLAEKLYGSLLFQTDLNKYLVYKSIFLKR
jgi:hypothetical protein